MNINACEMWSVQHLVNWICFPPTHKNPHESRHHRMDEWRNATKAKKNNELSSIDKTIKVNCESYEVEYDTEQFRFSNFFSVAERRTHMGSMSMAMPFHHGKYYYVENHMRRELLCVCGRHKRAESRLDGQQWLPPLPPSPIEYDELFVDNVMRYIAMQLFLRSVLLPCHIVMVNKFNMSEQEKLTLLHTKNLFNKWWSGQKLSDRYITVSCVPLMMKSINLSG